MPALSPRAAYALRCGLSIGVASLLTLFAEHVPAVKTAFLLPCTLLAPVFAGVTAQPLLGGALKSATHAVLGSALSVPLLLASMSAVGWQSDRAVFGSLTLLSLVLSWLPLPQLAAKLALAWVSITLFSGRLWPKAGYGVFDRSFAARMTAAGAVGCVVALAVVWPKQWPHSRAGAVAANALAQGEKAAASLAELLAAAAFPRPEAAGAAPYAAALRLRADALRATLAASLATLRAVGEALRWEVRALGARAAPRALQRRTAALQAHLLTLDGLLSAWDAGEAATRAHGQASERRRLMRLAHAAATGAPDGGGISRPSSAADLAALGAEALDEANELLRRLAGPAAALGAAASAALRSCGEPGASAARAEGGAARRPAAAAQRAREALAAFDAALGKARMEVYYAPSPRHAADASFFSPPPVEQQAFLFFLRSLAARCAEEAAAAAAEEEARPAPPAAAAPAGDRTALARAAAALASLAPPRPRLIYGLKLTLATVIAALLGQQSCGSGQWSAIAVQIVGARDGLFLGGGFRTAAQRAAGTAAGAFFVAVLLAVAEITHSYSVSSLAPVEGGPSPMAPLLAPLAAWATLCSAIRFDAKVAYGAMVASYSGYIILLDPASGNSGTSETGRGSSYVAYRRLEQNILGLLVWAAVELAIAPQRATRLLRPQLAKGLRAYASACAAVWAPALRWEEGEEGGGRPACGVAAAVASLAAEAGALTALLLEVEGEPAYHPLTVGSLAAWHRLVTPRLSPLLEMMALATSAHQPPGGAMDELLEAVRAPLRSLLASLCALFDMLAEWAEAPPAACAAAEAAAHEAARRVDAALRGLEGEYAAVAVRVRLQCSEERARVPPSAGMLALHALMLCTRGLVGVVHAVALDVRQLAPEGAEEAALEADAETEEAAEERGSAPFAAPL